METSRIIFAQLSGDFGPETQNEQSHGRPTMKKAG